MEDKNYIIQKSGCVTPEFISCLLSDISTEAFIFCDTDLRILWFNRAAERAIGKTKEEIMGSHCYSIINNSNTPCLNCPVLKAKEKGEYSEDEVKLSDDRIIFIKAHPVFDNRGEQIGIFVLLNDVTDFRKKERELKENVMKYQVLFDMLPVAVTVSDEEGNIIESNRHAEKILGIPKDVQLRRKIIGNEWTILRKDLTLMPPEEYATVRALSEKRLIENVEKGIPKKDGSITWIIVNAAPLPIEGYGVVAAYMDISSKKILEDELIEANNMLSDAIKYSDDMAKKAEQANRAKSDFLARMSHEIRTPMNGILSAVDLLNTTQLTNEQMKYITIIQKSGENLIKLINDILDLSKIEAGKFELEKAPFNLKDVLDEIVDMMQLKAREKGLSLHLEMDHEIPRYLMGDFNRLRQVIINLINNALKFTFKGGVTVSVRRKMSKEDKIFIYFAVIDTGIGIPKDKISFLFKPFTQIKRENGGTGLGLAISKQLVELMEGEIGVESEEGYGSVFWFVVPFEILFKDDMEKFIHQSEKIKKNRAIPDDVRGNIRLLVVEDNQINQFLTMEILKKMGYEADFAFDGLEALDMLKKYDYDLVLMDCEMPNMDGFEATRKIRLRSTGVINPDVTIIAMTAHALRDINEKCIEVGMNDCLTKPVKKEILSEVLEKWLLKSKKIKNNSNENDNFYKNQSSSEFLRGFHEKRRDVLIFDREDFLDRVIRDKDVALKVIEHFLIDLPLQILELNQAIEKGDVECVSQKAHRIKGSSLNISAYRLQKIAHDIEITGKKGDLQGIRSMIHSLEREFDILKKILEKFREEI